MGYSTWGHNELDTTEHAYAGAAHSRTGRLSVEYTAVRDGTEEPGKFRTESEDLLSVWHFTGLLGCSRQTSHSSSL